MLGGLLMLRHVLGVLGVLGVLWMLWMLWVLWVLHMLWVLWELRVVLLRMLGMLWLQGVMLLRMWRVMRCKLKLWILGLLGMHRGVLLRMLRGMLLIAAWAWAWVTRGKPLIGVPGRPGIVSGVRGHPGLCRADSIRLHISVSVWCLSFGELGCITVVILGSILSLGRLSRLHLMMRLGNRHGRRGPLRVSWLRPDRRLWEMLGIRNGSGGRRELPWVLMWCERASSADARCAMCLALVRTRSCLCSRLSREACGFILFHHSLVLISSNLDLCAHVQLL